MRFAVVQFGGSNCDLDTFHVLDQVLGIETDLVWYHDDLQKSYDAVVIPGGFSYGDYLRAGAIAARTRIMDQIREHAAAGGLVLGICNGAQILAESGLVPGIFTRNEDPRFICREALVRVENVDTPFTSAFSVGEVIRLPIAHGEGRYVAADEDYAALKRERRVAFRFCEEDGTVAPSANLNGSFENITGVLSNDRQVLAMMPHPERASEAVLGSTDGRRIFESMIAYLHR
ncbi:phosphoribosylformylglycinamidine synthase I [Methanosphaerula palustris]|uniref:Phosphoribosylformylglycinamidine synthase subunit PurQ n=1 Tax=Methanosphaerula palustris (strain ATCC BAA-1556 / DSM 19958 / E1-9c) TaxID=521011 RepID=B8GGS5_METPE|nr:phosphoribosylformylglycinamidine synthase I [Methanosphaerula palustris]ACL16330.1 phosphoribosylformylglycinamidine synthase I [Methanosphaerula palustris E1-9c]